MERLTAIDGQALNGDAPLRVRMIVDGADAAAISPRYRRRAYRGPELEQYEHDVRRFAFRVWPNKGSGLDADQAGELAWGSFDPERGARTLTMQRDPNDPTTAYTARVIITEFNRVEAFVWEGEFEFLDPYWVRVAPTVTSANPISVGGNAMARPTIRISGGEAVTHTRVTLRDATGHGFAGWPVGVEVGAGDESTFRVFFDGHEAPFRKVGTKLWFYAAGKAGQASYADIYGGAGIANTVYAGQLDTGGVDLASWSGASLRSDPAGARVQPINAALAWTPGITYKHDSSRLYTFGLDGDDLVLVDKEATGTRYALPDDADALVCASPVPITGLSGLGLRVHSGYRPGIRESQAEGAERVLRVTIADYNGGFETGPTNPEHWQHPDSRHPDRPYYAQWNVAGYTIPPTRSVTMDQEDSGLGTFYTRQKWFDDYLPEEFAEVIEKYLGVPVTTGVTGEWFLHYPAGAYLGAEPPDITMTIQPKSGEYIAQTIRGDAESIFQRVEVGNAALEYLLIFHTEWVDPVTLEPLAEQDSTPGETAQTGQVRAVVKYLRRDGETDWLTAWSQTVTGTAPNGTTQTISVPSLSFPAGTVAVAIGLEPVTTNPDRLDWGTLEVTSAPTITLAAGQMPSVTVASVAAQRLDGTLRNEASGATLRFREVFSDASGLALDTGSLSVEATGMVYGEVLPSEGVRMFELRPGENAYSVTGNLDAAAIEFEFRERLAV